MGKIIFLVWVLGNLTVQTTCGIEKINEEAAVKVCYEVGKEEAKGIEESLEVSLRKMEEMIGLTSQIDILDLQYIDGALSVDLSKELVAYGGGNEGEYQIISWLLNWGFEEMGVETMTILVEGNIEGFPEGNQIHQCTKEHYEMYYKWR